jgi:hypothetical protein
MDVESLAKQLILKGMTDEQQKAVLQSIRNTMGQARELQKQKVGEQARLVIEALKKIEGDIKSRYDEVGNKIEQRVASIKDGKDGRDGVNGRDGRAGRDGTTGPMGPRGANGRDGVDGQDGEDGVSVTDAHIDFDGSLIISLSSGRTINVGEVVAPDLAEKIKVITNGGGTSQSVLDALASLQTQINNLIPSQTGNAGKFLTTNGTSTSWADVAGGLSYQGTWNASTNTPTLTSSTGINGYYYVVSVAGSTNLNGITDWQAGDWLIFNGSVWQKIDQSWAIAGANDNITSMTGITGGISSPDFIQFDTGATVTNAAGRLYWDATQQTLSVGLNANIAADVGQTLYAYVTNDEAVTITKGQPVYMFAAAGDRVSVKLASNTTDTTSAKTLGVCAENIAAGQAGMVLCQGVQDGLNLAAYSPGDTLYVGATAGTLTSTKPYAPNHLVYVGVVERANMGNGRLYVRIQNGYELNEIHDVSAQSPSNGKTLIYNATTSLWEAANLTAGTGISIGNGAGSITVTNSAPDQTVALTGAGTTSVTGTYPNFTITSSNRVVEAADSTAALRITQTGSGNALLVEDSANPDSTPVVIDASGVLVVGHTTPLVSGYDVQSITTDGASYVAQRYNAGPSGVFMRMDKSRGASIGTNAIVNIDDVMGTLQWRGDDGTEFIRAAEITAAVDGTPGAGDMPGRLVFSTTADGMSTLTERMRITSAGKTGFATSAPAATVHVAGDTILSNVNVLGASYDSVSFSVAGQELTAHSLFFSPDGLKMYVSGTTGDDVNEYNLTTAWVVSSAVYSTTFSVSSQDATPQGLYFRADGTKMYVVGAANDSVFQYTLSTPWSVATASYDSISFSFTGQETTVTGLFFKPNGLSMYIVGQTNDTVYQYTLSTAWNVSTATLLQSFSVSGQELTPSDLAFTSDGSRMFLLGTTGDDINVYNLTTPWDISTAAFVNAFSVSGQDTSPVGLYVKPDGTKMYMVGSTNDTVYQYTVPSIDIQLTGPTSTNGNLTVQQDLTVYGRVGVGTASPSVSLAISASDAMLIPAGATGSRPTGVAGYLRFNTTSSEFEGYNGSAWASVGGGAAISNDTSTATNVYPLFAAATSGTPTTLYTGNAKLLYTPSTGEFKAEAVNAMNGIFVNSATIDTDYTIASGNNGLSAGPVSISAGILVTVSSGSVWTVA